MIGYYSADAIRAAEHATGRAFVDGVLMARAARALAQVVLAELTARTGGVYGRRVTLLVGAGDNGGDALYAGCHLRRRGVAVTAVRTSSRVHDAGLSAFVDAGGRVADALPAHTDLAVDAIVGLGGRGPLRDRAAALVDGLARVPVIAVDLPSGVDPDTGVIHTPSVRADVCVTFSLRRRAHLLAAPACGRIVVADIGIPDPGTRLTSPSDVDVADAWPLPGPSDDKYSQGVVGVIAGSAAYPGAAVLSTTAAVAATSGMTRYVGPAAAAVVARNPEVVAVTDIADAGRVQAWAIGPGIGVDAPSIDLVARVLDHDVPVLVDADALTVLAGNGHIREAVAARTAPTLLTPHAGEFARIARGTGSDAVDLLNADRLGAVESLAAHLNATVLLKGHVTLIADPDGTASGVCIGSSWAATAGSGDVLAGIVGALLAAGLDPRTAGATGATLHAHAAQTASSGAPIGASALAAAVRPTLRQMLNLRQWTR